MPHDVRLWSSALSKWAFRCGILLLATIVPAQAFAALGSSAASIREDQSRMNARVTVIQAQSYSVHILKSDIGVLVREYVSADGRVFAISWRGPFMPEMKLILGSYFREYRSALISQPRQMRRSFVRLTRSTLVVESVGHLRDYSGKAYDPTLIPSGVTPDELL